MKEFNNGSRSSHPDRPDGLEELLGFAAIFLFWPFLLVDTIFRRIFKITDAFEGAVLEKTRKLNAWTKPKH